MAVQYIGGPTVARVRVWLEAAGIAGGPMFQRLDKAGRPRGRLSTVSIRAIVQRRGRRCRGRGTRGRPLATGRRGAVPGRSRGLGRRDADRRPMAIPLDARSLYPRPARPPQRRGQAPLRGLDPSGRLGRLTAEHRIVFSVLVLAEGVTPRSHHLQGLSRGCHDRGPDPVLCSINWDYSAVEWGCFTSAKGPRWVRRSLAWPVQAGLCGSAKGSTCARSSPASGGVRRASKSHPKRFRSSGARGSSRTRLGR